MLMRGAFLLQAAQTTLWGLVHNNTHQSAVGDDHLSAKSVQENPALHAAIVGHCEHQSIALAGRYVCKTYACIATGGLNLLKNGCGVRLPPRGGVGVPARSSQGR